MGCTTTRLHRKGLVRSDNFATGVCSIDRGYNLDERYIQWDKPREGQALVYPARRTGRLDGSHGAVHSMGIAFGQCIEDVHGMTSSRIQISAGHVFTRRRMRSLTILFVIAVAGLCASQSWAQSPAEMKAADRPAVEANPGLLSPSQPAVAPRLPDHPAGEQPSANPDVPPAPAAEAANGPAVAPIATDNAGLSGSAGEAPAHGGELGSRPQTTAPRETSHLPSELSPWGMFMGADIVVKAVMIGLALASFLVWSIWLAKWAQLWLGRRRLGRDIETIAGQSSIDDAGRALPQRRSLALEMLEAARAERDGSGDILRPATLERIGSRLADIEHRVARDFRSGMSFLATVGATGPFVGLFGTVWGIMNSFIGISRAQTTNLAVVAPGIAEALLATAIGLVAAIPAVILYNNLGKGISGVRRLTRETRGEVERIASREMERQGQARKFPSLAAAAE